MWTQLQSFVGASLRSVEKLDWSWFFRFDAPLLIVTEAPWRLITAHGLAIAAGDHEQKFGLPEPVDASARVLDALRSLAVESVSEDEQTGDLRLHFGEKVYLEFLQLSWGYEAWIAQTPDGDIICMGGGQTVFEKREPR